MAGANVIGIDLGGTKVVAAVIDEEGQILGTQKERTDKQKDDEGVLGAIITATQGAIDSSEIQPDSITAIGVGAPGTLDPDEGVILFSPNLPFRNFPLAQKLQERFACRAYVANDANMGVYGEWQMGAGKGVANLIGIFVGTGVGGGLVLNNRLYEGFSRSAGEIGHVAITLGGPKCGCGNRGCLEAMSSRSAVSSALFRAIQKGEKSSLAGKFKGNPPTLRSKPIAKAYQEGDKLTVRIVDEAAEILGIGIGSMINILAPEMVVLGGGFVDALGKKYTDRVDKVARNWTFEVNRSLVKIVPAQLGDNAILQGAAAYARIKLNTQFPLLR